MTDKRNSDVTPDSLMEQFKGKGFKPIVTFTIVAHVVVILGSSIPFFVRSAFGADIAKRSEAERIDSAVEDATAALRKIAKKHGLNPQDISDQFSGKGSRTGKAGDGVETPAAATDTTDDSAGATEREKSAYETNLEVKVEGPTVPTFDDGGDDIF